ncbi:DinB family protein [Deinococcus sp. KNUC1210]|uniref:DinB family protein n=1 Tax=Deinococcus sp. KNUC1210 TaxID=2917691 RepID=UPI001EF0F79A|nr:DinB family protein [Deinococcus sp. KNUC1210]ULH15079.1 DinB family protein [Deinococcus sp. KNUC1210]
MTAPDVLLAGTPTRSDLGAALAEAERQVSAYFAALPDAVFFAGPGERWSPAQHLQHLTLAHRPLTGALRLPRLALLAVGGRTERESRSYAEMRQTYQAALGAGGKASGRYLPVLNGQTQAALVSDFRQASQQLREALEGWPEADLTTFLLPHPILGKITVREMLYFSVYHQYHHLNGVRSSVHPQESESEQ